MTTPDPATGTAPATDTDRKSDVVAPSPFVVVGGDLGAAVVCEGDVCAVPEAAPAPASALPLANLPVT